MSARATCAVGCVLGSQYMPTKNEEFRGRKRVSLAGGKNLQRKPELFSGANVPELGLFLRRSSLWFGQFSVLLKENRAPFLGGWVPGGLCTAVGFWRTQQVSRVQNTPMGNCTGVKINIGTHSQTDWCPPWKMVAFKRHKKRSERFEFSPTAVKWTYRNLVPFMSWRNTLQTRPEQMKNGWKFWLSLPEVMEMVGSHLGSNPGIKHEERYISDEAVAFQQRL